MTNNNQSLVETMQPYQRAVAIAQEVATEQLQTLLEQEIARIEVARASESIIHSSFIGTQPYTSSIDPITPLVIDEMGTSPWFTTETEESRNQLMWSSAATNVNSSGTVVDTSQPRGIGLWEQLRNPGPYVRYNRTDFSWPWRSEEKSSVDKFLDKLGILDEKQREFHKRFIRKDLEFDK